MNSEIKPVQTSHWFAIDFFIHASVRENSDLFYRSRILILILLAEIGIQVFASFILFFAPLTTQLLEIALSVTVFSMAPQIAALYILKHRANYKIGSALVIAQAFFAIVATTIFTGGPFESPPAQLLGVPCLMAFYFGGRRWGVITTITTVMTLIILIAMQLLEFPFPEIIHDSFRSFSMTLILPINFGTVMILALSYELTSFLIKKEHDQEHEKFVQLARTDPLTGLANRRVFDEMLLEKISLYSKQTPVRNFGLCYLDLDKFKPINDQFGHDVGDEVLSAVAKRLRNALRETDFLSRHGGDEFLMLLDEVEDATVATARLQHFLQLIKEPITTSAGVMEVGGSIGLAIFPLHGNNMLAIQKAADTAMYEAKRNHSGFLIQPIPNNIEN